VHARIPVAGHVLPSPVPDGGDYLLSVVEGIIVT